MGVAIEEGLRAKGFALIAGADEVGRGAFAGPLVAAAVILPVGASIHGLRDSKLCTAVERERLAAQIRELAIAISLVRVAPHVIDRRGLHKMNLVALRRAVGKLVPRPDYALTDGFGIRRSPVPCLGVKKGDSVSPSIAAASIVAKVVRDRAMWRLHRLYPEYGFRRNKGYGTPEHRSALDRLGPTPVHRLSFAGVGGSPHADVPPKDNDALEEDWS